MGKISKILQNNIHPTGSGIEGEMNEYDWINQQLAEVHLMFCEAFSEGQLVWGIDFLPEIQKYNELTRQFARAIAEERDYRNERTEYGVVVQKTAEERAQSLSNLATLIANGSSEFDKEFIELINSVASKVRSRLPWNKTFFQFFCDSFSI